jgi:hypothetical protein
MLLTSPENLLSEEWPENESVWLPHEKSGNRGTVKGFHGSGCWGVIMAPSPCSLSADSDWLRKRRVASKEAEVQNAHSRFGQRPHHLHQAPINASRL